MPQLLIPVSLDDDSGALLHASDAADEELAGAELRLEGRAAFGRDGDEQSARRLRVVAERFERARQAVRRDTGRCEVAVAWIAARADALARKVERAVDRRKALG